MGKTDDSISEILQQFVEHTVKELEEASRCRIEIKKDLTNIKIDIAKLQVKSAIIWGVIGGAITTAIGLGVWFLKKLT